MAMTKMHRQIMDKLEEIHQEVKGKAAAAPKITKAQLMEVKGVGETTADEILKLLKNS